MDKILYPTIGYLAYIQFSPKMGKIWWRNGNFTPMGAVKLIVYPFQQIEMWKPRLWDINYFMWLVGGYVIHKIIK